jgi:hypothetical protein
MSSSSLYDTFGNEPRYEVRRGKLAAFFENNTVNFPLPEASVKILTEISESTPRYHDPYVVEQVFVRLTRAGFTQPTSRAFAPILLDVAAAQGISVFDYFNFNDNSLKLAADAYAAINDHRPPGSRVGLVNPKNNRTSRFSGLIQP